MDKSDLNKILYEFFNTASEAEIKEFLKIVKEQKNTSPLKSLNFSSLAQKTAKGIKESFGLTQNFVSEIAYSSVAKIIRACAPELTDEQVEILLREFIPSLKRQSPPEIEVDMLRFMVNQFLAYSLGQMKEEEAVSLPANWPQKYWQVFPQTIRGLISKFLKAEIDGEFFCLALNEAFQRLEKK